MPGKEADMSRRMPLTQRATSPIWAVLLTLSLSPSDRAEAVPPQDDPARIEARVLGVDGKPVETSSVSFYRLVTGHEPRKAAGLLWHEAGTGSVWQVVGGAATGDRLTSEPLAP